MRLFFIGWNGPKLGFTDVVLGLKNQGHEIVYWSAPHTKSLTDKSKFPGTIFHEYHDALQAKAPDGVDASKFDPPDEELLKQLAGAESATMTMMNKLFEDIPLSERKHLYYRHVRYWNGVFKKFKPDLVIFPVAPHTVYDFVAYSVARSLEIKTLLFMLTRVGDRVLFMNDFVSGSATLKNELNKNLGHEFSVDDLSQDVRDYYKSQIYPDSKPTPKDIAIYADTYSGISNLRIKLRSLWTTITVLKDFSVFFKILTYFPRKFMSNQKTEYENVSSMPDLNKKFIYVPLNQQPENTTSPLGGVFVDQLLMVETLSASVPPDWLIYVKEHPLQWKPRGLDYFSYRYKNYYRTMAALPNVKLVPIDTDSFDMIEKAQCVSTVNGTAGWEALLRGKSSLAFGYAWYRDCPGVFKIGGADSCRAAIEKISSGNARISQQDIINYLFSFGKASIRAYTDEYLLPMATVSLEDSIKNYIAVITSEL